MVDSSVLIAAFASWHNDHERAKQVVAAKPSVVGHVLIETFSVLTRLPQPQRADPSLVMQFLEVNLAADPLIMPADEMKSVPRRLVDLGISGGSAYDAVIALTAARYGATLISLDRRAEPTYRRCGVVVEFIDDQPRAGGV